MSLLWQNVVLCGTIRNESLPDTDRDQTKPETLLLSQCFTPVCKGFRTQGSTLQDAVCWQVACLKVTYVFVQAESHSLFPLLKKTFAQLLSP